MIENKPFNKVLKCKLTVNEKAVLSQRVVELVSKKEAVENEKAAASSRFGGQLKEIWGEISEISKNHREGFELREVACYTEFSWSEGVAKVIRADTYEMVSSRTISDNERQMHIDEIENENGEPAADDVPQAQNKSGEIPDGGAVDQNGRDHQALHDLLTLVMDPSPTLNEVMEFSYNQRQEAWQWAKIKYGVFGDSEAVDPDLPAFLGGEGREAGLIGGNEKDENV